MSQNQVYFSLTAPMSATVVVHESDRMFHEIAVGKRLRIFYRGLWVGAFDIEKVVIEDTDEGLVKTVQGRGPMAWLEKALVWVGGDGKSEREFTGTYAQILLDLVNEAKARGALPACLVPVFTATADSEGKAISGGTVTLRLQVGSTLLDYVRSMWERGIWVRMRWNFEQERVELDWVEPPYGRDLTGAVKFRPGINAQLVRRTLEATDQATTFLVRASDTYLEVNDTGAVSTWGRKEELFYADQAGTNTEAQALAQDALAGRKEPHLSIELNVYDHDDGPRVFVEYGLADLVSVWNEHDLAWETYRIVGFFVDFDDAGRGVVRLELNREPRDPELAQARLVAKTGQGRKHELSHQADPRAEAERHNSDALAHRNLILGDAGGDVAGVVGNATVIGIQGVPVSNALPAPGHVLQSDGSQWLPGSLSASDVGADPAGAAAAVQSNLDAHINDTNNPHQVSKAQIGLAKNDAVGFVAQNSATQQTLPTNTWTKIDVGLNKEAYDPHGIYDVNTAQFVAPEDGLYLVGALVTLAVLESGKKLIVAIYKNGSRYSLLGRGSTSATDTFGTGGSMLIYLAAGDVVEVYAYHNRGSDAQTAPNDGYLNFWAVRQAILE